MSGVTSTVPGDAGAGRHSSGLRAPRRSSSAVLSIRVAAASVVMGAVVGLLWLLLAPRPDFSVLDSSGSGFLVDASGKGYLGADLVLGGLGALAGLGIGLVAVFRARMLDLGLLVALVLGGLVGSLVAAWTGEWLGTSQLPTTFPTTVEASLSVTAWAVLLAWPLVASAVFLFAVTAAHELPAAHDLPTAKPPPPPPAEHAATDPPTR